MTLKAIQYFCEICKAGSISKASARIFVTQQCLSKTVRNLESEFRCELFVRNRFGMQLTAKGQYLWEHGLAVLAQIEEMQAALTGYNAGGALHIELIRGVETVLSRILPSTCDGCRISYVEESATSCEEHVATGHADAAISTMPAATDKIRAAPLCSIPLSAVISERHRLAHGDRLTAKQLHGETLIICEPFTDSYRSVIQQCNEQGIEFQRVIHTVTPFASLHLCEQNQGVAIFPKEALSYFQISCPQTVTLDISDFSWNLFLLTARAFTDTHSAGISPKRHLTDALLHLMRSQIPSADGGLSFENP